MIEQPRDDVEARPPTSMVITALARSHASLVLSIIILLVTLVAAARAYTLTEQARVLVSERAGVDVARLERLERDTKAIVRSIEELAAAPHLRKLLFEELSEAQRNRDTSAPRVWRSVTQAAPPATATTDPDDERLYPSANAKMRELAQAPRTARPRPEPASQKPVQIDDVSLERGPAESSERR